MTPDELDRLADEATPGPWHETGWDDTCPGWWINGGGEPGSQAERGVAVTFVLPLETDESPQPKANAALIALAPQLAREHAALLRAANAVADTSPALMSDTPFARALNELHRVLALKGGHQ